jgi:hypothetical protein
VVERYFFRLAEADEPFREKLTGVVVELPASMA